MATLQILPSNGQQLDATREAIHCIVNLFEHPHTTRPALDVLA